MITTSQLNADSDELCSLEVDLPKEIFKRLQQQSILAGFASAEDYAAFLLDLEFDISFPNDPNLKD